VRPLFVSIFMLDPLSHNIYPSSPYNILCNGGSLYALYSLLSISNMLCVGGGEQGGKVSFQGHKLWALD
jgi:hypothetical protein